MLDVLMKCLGLELDNEAELLVLCALFSLLNISILYSVLAHSVLLASHVADDSIILVVKSAAKSTATR